MKRRARDAQYVAFGSLAVALWTALLAYDSEHPRRVELGSAHARRIAALDGARWVRSPDDVGESLPPTEGRSLFDQLFSVRGSNGKRAYQVPFPFSKVLDRINAHLDHGSEGYETGKVKAVLIPLGRSLQRNAAAPDGFFRSPRVVAFVDSPSRQNPGEVVPNLKDSLFIGYQEVAGVLEVISYNEGAGRFDYEVVHNYRTGLEPQVYYAQRTVCIGCHQNHTPLFSVRNWLETNANPKIAAQIAAANQAALSAGAAVLPSKLADLPNRLESRSDGLYFHGVPVSVSEFVPNQFEDATERAQLFIANQRLWSDGCDGTPGAGTRCRAAAFYLGARQALVGDLRAGVDEPLYLQDFYPSQAQAWKVLWPQGLAIPNPNIPNRDPFTDIKGSGDMSHIALLDPKIPPEVAKIMKESTIPVDKDPGTPGRLPLEVWRLESKEKPGPDQLLRGIAQSFTIQDLREMDRTLKMVAQSSNGGGLAAGVELTRWVGRCEALQKTDSMGGVLIQAGCAEDEGASSSSPAMRFKLNARFDSAGKSITATVEPFLVRNPGQNCVFAGGGAPCTRLNNLFVSEIHRSQQNGGLDVEFSLGRLPQGRKFRLPNGDSILKVSLHFDQVAEGAAALGKVEMQTLNDLQVLRNALTRMTGWDTLTYSRTERLRTLYKTLGTLNGGDPEGTDFSESDLSLLPAPVLEPTSGAKGEGHEVFRFRCAKCHDNTTGVPPPFMSGKTEEEIEANIRHCAPRILFRLYEWDKPIEKRDMGPMPYPSALKDSSGVKIPEAVWLNHPDLKFLRQEALSRLPAGFTQKGVLNIPDYTVLPACLPGGDQD